MGEAVFCADPCVIDGVQTAAPALFAPTATAHSTASTTRPLLLIRFDLGFMVVASTTSAGVSVGQGVRPRSVHRKRAVQIQFLTRRVRALKIRRAEYGRVERNRRDR